MDGSGGTPVVRRRLRTDLPLNEALQHLCTHLTPETNAWDVPALSRPQSRQLTSKLSQSKLPPMQRSNSVPGSWNKETGDSMRKSSRESRKHVSKNYASQLLEAYTYRGRDGSGTLHSKVRSKYLTLRNSGDMSKQVPELNKGARTRKDGGEASRSNSKHSDEASGDKKVGQTDRLDDGDRANTETKREDRTEKVSEAVLARKLNMPFDVLRDACTIFRKYSDFRAGYGMDLGQAKLDMNDFTKVICDLCDVPDADSLHPDFVDETFRTADRDGSGFIDVEEFIIWHASASFSEEMVISAEDQLIREIGRKTMMPLNDLERFLTAFRKYDLDGSGEIEFDEFNNLVHVIMKVPPGLTLPHERVQSLWRQADADGSGAITFEEFVLFYIARFGYDPTRSDFDFTSFYKIR